MPLVLIMKNIQNIIAASTLDEPYANECSPKYSFKDNSACELPGSEIEFLATILTGFLNISVQFIKVDLFQEMEQMLTKLEILGTLK